MSNLDLWEKVRSCPKEAQKEIKGGRLAGMTDISPVWRMKTLTEQFGPCGIGWYYEVTDKWMEISEDGQRAVFVQINLYIKAKDFNKSDIGEWSKPIVGVGGSMFIAKESKGLYTSDEAYKMALTDAISVSCKALGIAADIYWDKDKTKYTKKETDEEFDKRVDKKIEEEKITNPLTEEDISEMTRMKIKIENLAKYLGCKPSEITHEQVVSAIKTKKESLAKMRERWEINGQV